MEEKIFKTLMNKLKTIEAFSRFSPNSSYSPTDIKSSVGLINSNMNVESLSTNQVVLLHSLLHTFASNKSGIGLNGKTIENLHKEVVKKLPQHSKFDRLDEK